MTWKPASEPPEIPDGKTGVSVIVICENTNGYRYPPGPGWFGKYGWNPTRDYQGPRVVLWTDWPTPPGDPK